MTFYGFIGFDNVLFIYLYFLYLIFACVSFVAFTWLIYFCTNIYLNFICRVFQTIDESISFISFAKPCIISVDLQIMRQTIHCFGYQLVGMTWNFLLVIRHPLVSSVVVSSVGRIKHPAVSLVVGPPHR